MTGDRLIHILIRCIPSRDISDQDNIERSTQAIKKLEIINEIQYNNGGCGGVSSVYLLCRGLPPVGTPLFSSDRCCSVEMLEGIPEVLRLKNPVIMASE